MNKILLLIAILLTNAGLSQSISVNTSNYSVPQLVNSVLINSPCVSATNITWKTGTNFGSTNGIGYFSNTNPNFPMQSGVVLSTGNATNAIGPNASLLNDGDATWTGDANLENTLAAAGIMMSSKNATVLEFDFTPISPNFSFDFIFASEEYGNFQCLFSDAFAFLLTNTATGQTTNLAVVPNTTTPISVVTIRDFQYNSSCPSVNSEYFGRFNGGSQAAGSATNFNGQTKLLTAASELTPGVLYHIKLVIADRSDSNLDSAIFLSSDSFNIGQDLLGIDLKIANQNAICYGLNHTLTTGLTTSEYNFTWKKNGVILPGQNNSTLVVNQAGTYEVTYRDNAGNCVPRTDSVIVEYYPQIVSLNPNNLYKCDTGSTTYSYNLDLNTARVKQGLNPLTSVTYFASQIEANNNQNPISINYVSTVGATIYVRIQIPNTACHMVKSFKLLITPSPIANTAPNLSKCGRTSTGNNVAFNLAPQTAVILNGQSVNFNIVSYYTTLNNANEGTNPITTVNSFLSSGQTIYARVSNIYDPTCFSVTSFNLIVNPIPPVDVLDNVNVCNNYTLQPLTNGNYFTAINGGGTPLFAGDVITETQTIFIFNQPGGPGTCSANSSFKVTIIDPTQTPSNVTVCSTYTLPALSYGKYYTAPGGTGTQISAGTVITTSRTIYFYFITTVPETCIVDSNFTVTVVPSIEVGTRNDVFECFSYILPSLAVGNYYTEAGGNGTLLTAGTVINVNQTIYVYATSTESSNCSDEDTFSIFIGMEQPSDINQCNGYVLPALSIGKYYTGPNGSGEQIPEGTLINQNSIVYIFAETTRNSDNCTSDLHFTITIFQPEIDVIANVSACVSYILPTLTNGEYFTGSEGSGINLLAGTSIEATQTIYVFKRLNGTCFNQNSFTVTINALPAIDSRADIDICDQYVLSPLTIGNYYTGPNGTGNLLPPNTIITNSQLIYIYAISNTSPACSIQNTFQINIFSTTADALPNVNECDSYTLPTLSANNHYYTMPGGPNGGGVEIMPGTIIYTNKTIYIFKEHLIRISFYCLDETSFTVTIYNTPILPQFLNVKACNSYTLPQLTVGNYYTGNNGSGTLLHAGDIINSSQTLYVYAFNQSSSKCSNEKKITITIFNVDNLPNITTCESYTLPNLNIGKYYTGINGTGSLLAPGTVISNSTTIYIYGLSAFEPQCSDESNFSITIIDTPVVNLLPANKRTTCDTDGTNDGIINFNLTSLTATILGSQVGTEFNVTYHESMANATNGINPVASSLLSIVYARVSNALAPNCFDIKPITIIVNKLPEPKPKDGIICFDSETGTLLNAYTIYSELSSGLNSFVWSNELGNTVATSANYQAIVPGIFTLKVKNNNTGCLSIPIDVTVTPSEPALVSYEVSEDFADNQTITVTAIGQGNNFEFQLNNGVFQDSTIFENVTSGIHTITVRDKNGCGSTKIQALVINYPKYFTPNGDGFNDSWNIKDLSAQSTAIIQIYDRYGKLITQIKPNNSGWDGTYNGNLMASDDYWFSVTYRDEDNNGQEFKAHFAMKR